MRDVLTTLLELLGFALIVIAAFTINLVAGLVVAGLACIILGWLIGRRT